MTRYDDKDKCIECGARNEIKCKSIISGHVAECTTVCRKCKHKGYWAYGWFQRDPSDAQKLAGLAARNEVLMDGLMKGLSQKDEDPLVVAIECLIEENEGLLEVSIDSEIMSTLKQLSVHNTLLRSSMNAGRSSGKTVVDSVAAALVTAINANEKMNRKLIRYAELYGLVED